MSTQHIKNYVKVALAFILMLGQHACNFIEVAPPVDQLVTGTVFADPVKAEAAVMGLYSEIVHANSERKILNGSISLYAGLSADELAINIGLPEEKAFLDHQITPQNNNNYRLWRTGYNHIYQANVLIENLNQSVAVQEEQRKQLLGEIHFIRALVYFHLVNLYGPVPLVTSSDYRKNATLSQSGTAQVYEQIIADLKYAQLALSPEYPTAGKTRVNSWAATALLSRIYLYTGSWDQAVSESSAVIGSGQYHLAPLASAFLGDNVESIFAFYPSITGTYHAVEGSWFIPVNKTIIPDYPLASELIADFEPGDLRKKQWVDSTIVDGNTYYYAHKYKIKNGANTTDKTEFNQVLRLGELYLIRAEAYAQLGNLNPAIADLDSIRSRAGLPLFQHLNETVDTQELLAAIRHERRIELFAEWGHRWFDLKRIGQLEAILSSLKPGFKATAALFPIPERELLVNPFLTQHDGY